MWPIFHRPEIFSDAKPTHQCAEGIAIPGTNIKREHQQCVY